MVPLARAFVFLREEFKDARRARLGMEMGERHLTADFEASGLIPIPIPTPTLTRFPPMIDYDPHNWFSHLLDIKGSMAREIFGRVLTCVGWSAVVMVVHFLSMREYHISHIGIPPTVHSMVGFALGLLLVFRTNASYDRFWEGRRMWGSIINETRNLARAASVYLEGDRELVVAIVRWTIAWPYAAMGQLRDEPELGPIAARLPRGEVEEALAADHVPLHVARRMTGVLAEARDRGLISDYLMATLDQNVQLLIDYLGSCERIHRTPLPFAYVVHLRRALILYCFTLPFALVGDFGWGAIVGTFLVTYVFFGIEEIGVEIEDPFGRDDNDLPLDDICRMIERNLLALIGELPAPAPEVEAA